MAIRSLTIKSFLYRVQHSTKETQHEFHLITSTVLPKCHRYFAEIPLRMIMTPRCNVGRISAFQTIYQTYLAGSNEMSYEISQTRYIGQVISRKCEANLGEISFRECKGRVKTSRVPFALSERNKSKVSSRCG